MVDVRPYTRRKAEFKDWQKNHPNFMTPEFVDAYLVGDYVIEISKGENFEHENMFGVTVWQRVGDTYKLVKMENIPQSELFPNITTAINYAEEIKEKLELMLGL